MIKRIAHVCLNVKDLNKTTEFYNGVLQIPIKFTFSKAGRRIGAYFEAGPGNYIEIFEKPGKVVTNTGIVHFCLETEDIDNVIYALRQHGISCTDKKKGCDQAYQAWASDPDGNRIELHQYTENSAQIKGGTVEVTW